MGGYAGSVSPTNRELARRLLEIKPMSSLENIYQKMVPAIEPPALAQLQHQNAPSPEPQRLIAREVAHELNNILTIIQGYSDRLVLKNGENPALRADLQLIADNARRAIMVVRNANPRRPAPTPQAAPVLA
jgi:signal transduction histidine kinase